MLFRSTVFANLCTIIIVILVWSNLKLLQPYAWPIFWALLISLALFPVKVVCREALRARFTMQDMIVAAYETTPIHDMHFLFSAWRRFFSPLLAPTLLILLSHQYHLTARGLAAVLHVHLPSASHLTTPCANRAPLRNAQNVVIDAADSPASTLTAGTTDSSQAQYPKSPVTAGQLFWTSLWAGYIALAAFRSWQLLFGGTAVYLGCCQAYALVKCCLSRRRIKAARTLLVKQITALSFIQRCLHTSFIVVWTACRWVAEMAIAAVGLDALSALAVIVGVVLVGGASVALLFLQLYHEWTTELLVFRWGCSGFSAAYRYSVNAADKSNGFELHVSPRPAGQALTLHGKWIRHLTHG